MASLGQNELTQDFKHGFWLAVSTAASRSETIKKSRPRQQTSSDRRCADIVCHTVHVNQVSPLLTKISCNRVEFRTSFVRENININHVMLSSIHAQTSMALKLTQDGRHFADDIFTCIFFNENCCILIKFSLKYVCKGPIDNNWALVQIMAWRRLGDKPLSEPIMIYLPTHICVTRPQWVKD